MFNGEETAGASHAGLDFIVDEERSVLAAQGRRVAEIPRRRKVDAFALHRFDYECRHVPLAQFAFQCLKVIEGDAAAIWQKWSKAASKALIAIHGEGAAGQPV